MRWRSDEISGSLKMCVKVKVASVVMGCRAVRCVGLAGTQHSTLSSLLCVAR